MTLTTSTVSWEGYARVSSIRERWTTFTDALRASKSQGSHFVCLPGGYFCVASENAAESLAKRIATAAARVKISVAVGIDLRCDHRTDRKKRPSGAVLVRKHKLPAFAMCWSPKESRVRLWRQRSVTCKDQWEAPDSLCQRVQAIIVVSSRVAVLTCGEIFNSRIRESIRSHQPKIRILVDLCHRGVGFRVDNSMKRLARQGLHVFCSAHVGRYNAMKRAYTPGGRKCSSRAADRVIIGPPRIELKHWDLGKA